MIPICSTKNAIGFEAGEAFIVPCNAEFAEVFLRLIVGNNVEQNF